MVDGKIVNKVDVDVRADKKDWPLVGVHLTWFFLEVNAQIHQKNQNHNTQTTLHKWHFHVLTLINKLNVVLGRRRSQSLLEENDNRKPKQLCKTWNQDWFSFLRWLRGVRLDKIGGRNVKCVYIYIYHISRNYHYNKIFST